MNTSVCDQPGLPVAGDLRAVMAGKVVMARMPMPEFGRSGTAQSIISRP